MNLYIGKDGKQLGPFAKEQVLPMVEAGLFSPTDLGWHDGIPNWIPLHELLGVSLPASSHPSPPLLPSTEATRNTASRPASSLTKSTKEEAAAQTIKVDLAMRWLMTSTGAGVLLEFAPNRHFLVMAIISTVFEAIYCSILHYRCWSALPERFRATTPARAVGFLFIPFFNFYWAFVTWPKLVKGLEAWEKSRGRASTENLHALALGCAATLVASFLLFQVPLIAMMLDITFAILFYSLYTKVAASINAIQQEDKIVMVGAAVRVQ